MVNAMRKQQGVAYMWLLLLMLFMSIMIGTAIEGWSTSAQRVREQQLLWTGDQYRQAIRNYYEQSPGGNKQYPLSLDELLEDKRYVTIQRHLRKLYHDPITGKPDWTVITSPDGRIIGVASRSERKPVKTGGFSSPYQEFRGKQRYADWKFVYEPAPPPAPSAPPKP